MDLVGRYGRRFGLALGFLSLADLVLLGIRVTITDSHRYDFIPWNLALAWLSLLFAGLLVRNLKKHRWSSNSNLLLTLGWLVFLPNTWYVLTDFIHVFPNGEISQLYDIVLISLLVFIGFILGFASLFLVHRQLLARFGTARSWLFIEAAILAASFAIYLGRDLRWNSWDVVTNPAGVLVNAGQGITDPFGNPRALNITVLFFFLINVLYWAFWLFSYAPGRRRH